MDPLSRRLITARYCIPIIAMWVVALVAKPPHSITIGFLGFIAFAAFVSLKYIVFDGIVSMLRRRWPAFMVLPWLWVGYVLVLGIDLWATWVSMSDESGSNLALAATILVTPWILVITLVLMTVHTLIVRKPRKKHAKRTA